MASTMAGAVVTFLIVLHLAPLARSSLKDIVLYQGDDDGKDNVAAGSGEEVKETTEDQTPAPTWPRLPPVLTERTRVKDQLLCHAGKQLDTWRRHPANCSRYFVCSGGQVSTIEAWASSSSSSSFLPSFRCCLMSSIVG